MGNTIGLIRHFYIKEISRMTFDKGMGSFSKMGKSNIRVNGWMEKLKKNSNLKEVFMICQWEKIQ